MPLKIDIYYRLIIGLAIWMLPAALSSQTISHGEALAKADALAKNYETHISDSIYLALEQKALQSKDRVLLYTIYTYLASNRLDYFEFNESMAWFEKADQLSLPEKQIPPLILARNAYLKANWYHNNAAFKQSQDNYYKALELLDQLPEEWYFKARTLLRFAQTQLRRNNPNLQKSLIDQAFEIMLARDPDPNLLGIASLELARYYRLKGQWEAYFTKAKQAEAYFSQAYGTMHPKTAIAIQYQSHFYDQRGDLNAMLTCLERTQSIFDQLYPVHRGRLGQNAGLISNCYRRLGRFEEAHVYIDISIQNLQEHLQTMQSPILADMYRRKALIYEAQDSMAQALALYNQSMEFYGGQNRNKRDRSRNFQGMARAFLAKGNLDSAAYWNRQDFDNLIPTYGPDFVQLAESYRMAGLIYYAKGEYENAIAQFQLGLEKSAPTFKALTWKDLPQVQQFEFVPPVLSMLNHRARALQALYQAKGDHAYLESAYETYQLGIAFIASLRSSYQEDETKEIIQKEGAAIYQGAIESLRAIGEKTNFSTQMDSLFKLVNDSKSILLQEAAYDRAARDLAQIPDSLLEYEQELRMRISSLKYKQGLDDNPRLAKERRYELSQLMQYLEAVRLEIKNDYPKYYDIKFEQKRIGIEDVQEALSPDQAYLQYYFTGEHTFVFLIQKDSCSLIDLAVPKDFDQQIIAFRSIIATPESDLETFAAAASTLYQQLFSPIKAHLSDQVDHLLIVPDGALSYLPFDVLLTQEKKQASYIELPYLLREYTISYSFTPSLWINDLQRETKKKRANKMLAIAPSYQENKNNKEAILSLLRNETLGNLPGAKEEARGIAALLHGDTLIGLAATEAAFRAVAEEYDFFHLSMHGVLDDEHPENAYLAFQQEDPSLVDEWNDNYLRIAELYGMQLDAELVVLSACNTGIGNIHNGEGMLSLSRAFKYSGVKSLVTSLWSVSDFSTKELMLLFYDYLKQGYSKDLALKKAKLTYLEQYDDPLFSHPFYWSGFNVVGDVSPVYKGRNMLGWWIAGVLLFILVLFQVRKLLVLS